MPKIAQLVKFLAKPARSEEFGQRLQALVSETRKEPGCLRYELYRDTADHWIVFETWADAAAIDYHMQQPLVVDLLPELGDFLAEDTCVEQLEIIA